LIDLINYDAVIAVIVNGGRSECDLMRFGTGRATLRDGALGLMVWVCEVFLANKSGL
jgi:hypothetical protein